MGIEPCWMTIKPMQRCAERESDLKSESLVLWSTFFPAVTQSFDLTVSSWLEMQLGVERLIAGISTKPTQRMLIGKVICNV